MFTAKQQIGPYTLIRKLGRGGFGEVWLAERRTEILTTKVAIKLPLQTQIDIEEVKREATLWEKASGHPNVLPIIEANVYDGQIVIVSEYASDGSLADLISRERKLSVEKSIEIMSGILSGLEFLHARRIIHRDLKPANVLLQGNTPRLADFGISRALRTTQTSSSNTITGTWEYMAPEAFDGKRNIQTDVWSAGVTLYKLLTGRMPFPQTEPTALVGAIMTREPDPLPYSIPQVLRNVVLQSLSKDPAARFKSASQMSTALQNGFSQASKSDESEFATLKLHDMTTGKTAMKTTSPEYVQPSLFKSMLKYFLIIGGLVFFFGIIAVQMVIYINSNKQGNQNSVSALNANIRPEAVSSPTPTPSPSPTPNIRTVNFKRITYPARGEGITSKDIKFLDVVYGDLNGDGIEEAAVSLAWTWERYGGNGWGSFCNIYELKESKPVLIAASEDFGGTGAGFYNSKLSIKDNLLLVTGCYRDGDLYYHKTEKYELRGKSLKLVSAIKGKSCV